MRNSFKTVAMGRLIPDGASTRIRCRLGPHPFVIIVMAVWLGFVGSAAIAFGFGTGSPSVRGAPVALAPANPALMLVAGAAVFALGRFAASGQREILISMLTKRLEVRPVEVSAATS